MAERLLPLDAVISQGGFKRSNIYATPFFSFFLRRNYP